MKKVIIFLFVIYSVSIAAKLLFDEKHCCEIGVWNNLLDTLVSYGTLIFNTLDVGLEFVENVDILWIENPGCSLGFYPYPYTDYEKHLIISFSEQGGKILVGLSGNSGLVYITNELLLDESWEPSVVFKKPSVLVEKIFINYIDFEPFSYKGQRVTFEYPWDIVCGQNCYPIFMDSLGNFFATISFPFPNDTNCGYVIAVTGNHFWEDRGSCIENAETTDTYTFAKNILLCMANVPGHILNKCSLPEPYQIEITSTPLCASPGDTIRIRGRNLWRGFNESLGGDIEIYIGATERVPHDYDTIIIPIRYAHDSTWLEFVVPDFPPGTYPIRLGHKAITFDAGDIIVPCPMVAEIPECANPGDTVVVSGINLLPDIVIQIDDIIIESINYALGYDTIEFVCPSLPPGDYEISFFWDTLEIFSGSILIPCPTAPASFPECADPGDVITISGENLVEPIRIVVGDSVVSAVSYSEDRSKVAFRCPWLPRGRYRVNLSWHDMFVASGTIEIPCPHRCERFPNPITPNFDAVNDFAQFEFDGIFVKPARIHIFDIHSHEIRTIDVPAGLSAKQHARWDGTDDDGNPVPEGVYIYTIEVAGEVVCEGTVTVAR